MMEVKAYLRLIVRDREGRVVRRVEVESRSFLLNFIRVLKALFAGQHNMSVTLLDGGSGRFDAYCFVNGTSKTTNWWCHLMAPKEDDSYGIVVGLGTRAVTPDDYNLESKIPHGTTAGKLYYHGVESEVVSVEGNVIKFKVKRFLDECAGSSVDVNEVGLVVYHRCTDDDGDTRIRFLIARDVLPSTVTVPAYGNLFVEYEIRCTV